MEYIDASNIESEKLNKIIAEKLTQYGEVTIENPHSMHNIGTGLEMPGTITINGSTGFYTGGFMKSPSILVDGNTGWYVGDNMQGGELLVKKNTGSNAGVYLYDGTLVIYGGTGSRVGYGMKGGTIIVCGPSGRWAGQMTLGGKLVLLGKIGKQVGESMYKGSIYVADEAIEENLGGNVYIDSIHDDEIEELNAKFEKYKIDADAAKLRVVRPSVTGRHKYVLFKPQLDPALLNRTAK